MGNYQYKRLEDSTFINIKSLYKTSFNINISLKNIIKKYNTQYTGKKNIGYLAFDLNQSPAAYYGVFPYIFKINNDLILAAQSGDTMTDPKHRKKGLFIDLAKKTYKLSKQEGINFIFGFPNKNSFPGFKEKLNWNFIGNMFDYKIKVNTIPIAWISQKFKLFRKSYILYSRLVLKVLTSRLSQQSFETFLNHGDFYINKNIDFYKYKLAKNIFLIKYGGFVIYIKLTDCLEVGEAHFFNKEMTKEFIVCIKKLAFFLGCHKIRLSLSKNHWLHSYLTNEITPETGLPIGILALKENNINMVLSKIQFCRADYDTF